MSEEIVEDTGGEGQTKESWYSQYDLDDSTVGYLQSKGWESPVGMLDSYRSLESFRGVPEERILKLPEEMLPENMGDIYEKLGRPSEASKYTTEIPEGLTVDDARLASLQEVAFKNGMSDGAYKDVLGLWNQMVMEENESFVSQNQAERETQELELKREWGTQHDESLFLAEKAIRSLGISDEERQVIEVGVGYDRMMKIFNSIAMSGQELNTDDGDRGSDFGMTPEKARFEMDQIKDKAKIDPVVMAQFEAMAGPDYARYKQLQKLRHG